MDLFTAISILDDDTPSRETKINNRKMLKNMNNMELLILYFLIFGKGSYHTCNYDQLIERINELKIGEKLTKSIIKNFIRKLFKIGSTEFCLDYGTWHDEYVNIGISESEGFLLKHLIQTRLGYLPAVWKHRKWSKERKQQHSKIMKEVWKKRKI